MATLIIPAILAVLVGINILLYNSFRKQKEKKIICAEAGPTKDISRSIPCNNPFTFFDKITANGKVINEREYFPITVKGSCMERRNIFSGDILYVKKVNALSIEEKKEIIKEKDILLIYLPEKDEYKIREFEDIDSENRAKTFYYNSDGSKHYSTFSHDFQRIEGIISYKVPA